jgi:CDP-4-dehydro-6-deoxyglucose reductase, E3
VVKRVGRTTEQPFEVADLALVAGDVMQVALRPMERPLIFMPGQYLLLRDCARHLPPRPYSIANAPREDGGLSLLVARVPRGAVSGWVHDRLRIGHQVAVSGPFGAFIDDQSSTAPAVYLAAGSGLAPIRSLLEAGVAESRRLHHTLVFSARTEGDVIDVERFRTWQERREDFRFVRTLTGPEGPPPHGRIPDLLPALFPRLTEEETFIAGSPAFVKACVTAVHMLDGHHARVHTEVFYEEPQPWQGRPPERSREEVGHGG